MKRGVSRVKRLDASSSLDRTAAFKASNQSAEWPLALDGTKALAGRAAAPPVVHQSHFVIGPLIEYVIQKSR
jgi:hypothetical protein